MTIDSIFCIFFLKILVIFIFVVIFLVQFCVILVRNCMFYIIFFSYYVIDTVYIYTWKKIDKSLTHFGEAFYKKHDFWHVKCSHLVVQLYNGVTSPCHLAMHPHNAHANSQNAHVEIHGFAQEQTNLLTQTLT